jgi:putative hemolysin
MLKEDSLDFSDKPLSYQSQFADFERKIPLRVESGRFLLKTAEGVEDLLKLGALRHEVFHREFLKSLESGYDFDRFDLRADHLMVIDKKTDELLGTYRLIQRPENPRFYSEDEFRLEQFLKTSGKKLELGRACVRRSHRTGMIIHLLWRGLAAYLLKAEIKYLFGCASIKTENPKVVAEILQYFKKTQAWSDRYQIRPTPNFEMPSLKKQITEQEAKQTNELEAKQRDELKAWVPPLLHSYFKSGALTYGEPAYDRDFKCVDFLTILNCERLSASRAKRYLKQT